MTTFLKKLRQEQDISQEFLAKKIGVSRPTYVQIESGTRKMLVEEAQKLSQFFGLLLEDFLSGKNTPILKVALEKSKNQKKREPEMRISIPQEKVKKFNWIHTWKDIAKFKKHGQSPSMKLAWKRKNSRE